MIDKPFSQACVNNRQPILDQLKVFFANSKHVLEIGSGTGQHAVYMGAHLPHLTWQTSDLLVNHAGIQLWLNDYTGNNVLPPLNYHVGQTSWPIASTDSVYSANTAHIMQASEVQKLMATVENQLSATGYFCQYGPFTINGQFTSDSNQAFDSSLRQRGYGGIRDIQELQDWAPKLKLIARVDMPANNMILVWEARL